VNSLSFRQTRVFILCWRRISGMDVWLDYFENLGTQIASL
jgi:hypothetical protein